MIQLGSVVLLLATSKAVLGGVTGYRYDRRGVNPANPHDDNTTQHCSWWLDYNEETPCDQILQDSSITLEQFRRWVRENHSRFCSRDRLLKLTNATEPVSACRL